MWCHNYWECETMRLKLCHFFDIVPQACYRHDNGHEGRKWAYSFTHRRLCPQKRGSGGGWLQYIQGAGSLAWETWHVYLEWTTKQVLFSVELSWEKRYYKDTQKKQRRALLGIFPPLRFFCICISYMLENLLYREAEVNSSIPLPLGSIAPSASKSRIFPCVLSLCISSSFQPSSRDPYTLALRDPFSLNLIAHIVLSRLI